MKIALIGSNSFLGYNLAQTLINMGYSPMLYYNKNKELCHDLPKLNQMEAIYKEKYFDIVILVSSVIPNTNRSKNDFWDGNISLPYKLVEQFNDSKFIYTSSVSVYGNQNIILNENSLVSPNNTYSESKFFGEILMKYTSNYQIIRFSSIYGINQKSKTFLPFIIESALLNKAIELFGNGSRKQNYINVKDAVSYIIQSIGLNTSNILLGVDLISYTNKEVAEIISKIFNCEIKYKAEDNSISYEYSNTLTQNVLNWKPEVTLIEGIKEIINYKLR